MGTRRSFLTGMGAAALAGGAFATGLTPARAVGDGLGASGLPDEGERVRAIVALLHQRGIPELARAVPFELRGKDLPWMKELGEVRTGQQVTFLLAGRWYLARAADLWVEPGVAFHARADKGQLYNSMANTGTMTADRDGPLAIARSAGEWASPNGDLATPTDVYLAAEGRIEGVALIWNGDARTGLARLAAMSDVAGLIHDEIARLDKVPVLPPGWKSIFLFGNGDGTFRSGPNREILCSTHKSVGIVQRPVALQLAPGATLEWSWVVDELPAPTPEDEIGTHDYLSIAVEFDDGQDLTYMWSAGLPSGHVFRCPLPLWAGRETHMVVRTGRDELGQWLSEARPVHDDYKAHVGGDARHIVGVWLIANSVFLRRSGRCRYRNIVVSSSGLRQTVL
ncbi:MULTISPECIES: DUF3047 domain-containing protein [Xanthobacter]|uniref:DUF3047 domain-containing protein n=1 Tax=Xanthobacter TaxID=279 RepID=UPI0024A76769|nr:DUF3047 domain-containing protein [Xanthobacter autotrophicus]MDI4659060.1 DUF3047 domain-containing protein [Xanthobacter autotrophicus]MDI4665510.1 DUF3047 domain-containing protein [Xanthobacter autotrophicus]